MKKKLDKKEVLHIYKKMVQIRKFEEKLYQLFLKGTMPGAMHQYNGQEAVAVGVCENLGKDDYITSTHRGHGHCVAKGADINGVMAEMFAKKTGSNRGMGGSMHIADFSVGMLGANGIVGAGIPHAVGAAWTCNYKKTGGVAIAFFGDGASNEGSFHESINLAAIWKLPVIFVCENNLYGFSTHYRRVTPIEDIADRGASYGIPGVVADGMDVMDVYEKAKKAVEVARKGGGPTLLECKTYRFMGHSRFEKPTYRTDEELEKWKKRDPIPLFEKYLKDVYGIGKDKIKDICTEVDKEMDSAVAFAEKSPDTDPMDYKEYIYA